jgi:integrase
VVYRYWKEGLPGITPPIARSIVLLTGHLVVVFQYLAGLGVRGLGQVHPIHISGFIHHRRTVDRVKPGTLVRNLLGIELLYRFRSEDVDSLGFHPWPGSSAGDQAGHTGPARSTGGTALIPPPVLQQLYVAAEGLLARADTLLNERDLGLRITGFDRELNLLRDACFFLLGVLTGMRCEEIAGLEVGAGRRERKDGLVYNWVKSIEHKTKKGRVEYLMPAVGHRVLKVMERWSAPLRHELRHQVLQLEGDQSPDGMAERMRVLAAARADCNRLFLGREGRTQQVRTVSGLHWAGRMKTYAAHAGVDWRLCPHQLRRVYAWTFVRHRLGNILFLKEQFKHSSIEMTQLYVANPMQDDALFEELFTEISVQKVELVEGWLNADTPLAGRAGQRIAIMRAHDFPTRRALIEETADWINIRSTGHSWCLAQDDGCGGAGLYEPGRCGSCNDSVIDSSQRIAWEAIHAHQLELQEEARELGQAAVQRVQRDLQRAADVLKQLAA